MSININPNYMTAMRSACEMSTEQGVRDWGNAGDERYEAIVAVCMDLKDNESHNYSESQKSALKYAFTSISQKLGKESKVSLLDEVLDQFRKIFEMPTVVDRKERLAELKEAIDSSLQSESSKGSKDPESAEEALCRFQSEDFEKIFGTKPESMDAVDLALLEVVSEAFWASSVVENAQAQGKSEYDVFKKLMEGFYDGSHILIPEEKFVASAYDSLMKSAKTGDELFELQKEKMQVMRLIKGMQPQQDQTPERIETMNEEAKKQVFGRVMSRKLESMGYGPDDKMAQRFSSHYGPVGRFRQFQLEGKAIPAILFDVGVMAEMQNNEGKTEVVSGIYYQDIKDMTRAKSQAKNEKMLKIWSKNHGANTENAGEIQKSILEKPGTKPRRYVNLQTEGRPDWTINKKGGYIFSFKGLAHRVFDFVIYQYRLRTNPSKAQVGPYGAGGLPDITPIEVK